jgi:hypothetical protein
VRHDRLMPPEANGVPATDELRAPGVPKAWALAVLSAMWGAAAVVCLSGRLKEPTLGAASIMAAGIGLWGTVRLVRRPVPPRTRETVEQSLAAAEAAVARRGVRLKLAHLFRTATIFALAAAVAAGFVGWEVAGELRVRRDGIPVSFEVLEKQGFTTARGNPSSRLCLIPVGGTVNDSQQCLKLSGTNDFATGEILPAHVDRNDPSYIVLDGILPNDAGFFAFALAFAMTFAAMAALSRLRPLAAEIGASSPS